MATTIPKRVVERLSGQLGRFQKVLEAAMHRDVNEADTVTIVTDMLADLFGYDKYTEITGEFAVRNTFCDLAVVVDDKPKFLLEVKAIGIDLKENHLRQALDYGANHGIDWVVLTNGIEWQIHRVRFERPISHDLVCTMRMQELNGRRSEDQECLFLLCKEALGKAAIEDYHAHRQTVNRFALGALLLSEPVLKVLRRELRRIEPNIKVDTNEIAGILRSEVLKRDVLEGDAADQMKQVLRRSSRRALRRPTSDSPNSPTAQEVSSREEEEGHNDDA